jgi:hypothetical protein
MFRLTELRDVISELRKQADADEEKRKETEQGILQK